MGMVADATKRRRQMRQEELREKLRGLEYINQLDRIDQRLQELPGRDELEVLKVRIDLNFRRLAKLLPDEKFLEIEASVSNHETALAELDLALGAGSEDTESPAG